MIKIFRRSINHQTKKKNNRNCKHKEKQKQKRYKNYTSELFFFSLSKSLDSLIMFYKQQKFLITTFRVHFVPNQNICMNLIHHQFPVLKISQQYNAFSLKVKIIHSFFLFFLYRQKKMKSGAVPAEFHGVKYLHDLTELPFKVLHPFDFCHEVPYRMHLFTFRRWL